MNIPLRYNIARLHPFEILLERHHIPFLHYLIAYHESTSKSISSISTNLEDSDESSLSTYDEMYSRFNVIKDHTSKNRVRDRILGKRACYCVEYSRPWCICWFSSTYSGTLRTTDSRRRFGPTDYASIDRIRSR